MPAFRAEVDQMKTPIEWKTEVAEITVPIRLKYSTPEDRARVLELAQECLRLDMMWVTDAAWVEACGPVREGGKP